jgi:signal transduction histidine kinase/ligand-binding sensor domain-containing protein
LRREFLALAVLLLLPSAARAERLPVRSYTTADGLAHNEINKIVRDSRGFLWFATNDGLSRFDGYTFMNYGVEQGLPHPTVMDLLETSRGDLWVATYGGLVRFRPDGVPADRPLDAADARRRPSMFSTIVPPGDDPRAKATTVVFESRDGTIWCGTRNGLFRLDPEGVLRGVELGLPDQYPEQRQINDLVEDEHASLWVVSPSGLYRRWRDGSTARYAAPGFLVYDHLHDLMKDRDGGIWVASRYDGFFRLRADGSRTPPAIAEHHAYPRRTAAWVFRLLETSDRRFWVGSNVGLVEFRRDGQFFAYNRRHGLAHQEIAALAEDAAGNLWIGTWSGAMKLTRNGFITYGRQDGIAAGVKLFEDAAGQLHVIAHTFEVGLPGKPSPAPDVEHVALRFGRFAGGRFQWVMPRPPFSWGWIPEGAVLQTRDGGWWLAGGTGVFRYAPSPTFGALERTVPIRSYAEKDGLPGVQVFRMMEDSRGNVWLSINSQRKGLFRWDRQTDTFSEVPLAGSVPPAREELPLAIAEDRAGNVWVGLSSGVARYRDGRATVFSTAHGLPPGPIGQIYVGAGSRVWMGSARGGLIRLDDPAAEAPVFTRYTMAQGLSGNRIEAITEDRQGRIYAATGHGVDQLEPVTGRVRHFTTDDGLASGWMVAAFRDRTGALWFGTHTGLSRFVPAATETSAPPSVVITGLTAGGAARPISAVGQTDVSLPDLAADRNQLQIEFGSIDFAAGGRHRYQYRLHGADADWSAPTPRRSVSYASLAPGSYRFVVRAVTADGIVSSRPAAIAFTVLRPVWQRWWFLSLAGVAVVAAGHALHRYRLGRTLELERVRTRIATDLHDDVGANLTRIAILSEVARQQPRPRAAHLDAPLSSIADIARESVATMNDIVWAINPERDTLRDMVRRMRDHAEEVFESREIRLTVDMPDAAPPSRLGVDVRRDLYLIFKEAVNNATRHSRCSSVAITLRVEGGRLRLEVSDNGTGVDLDRHTEGNGLASMKRRAARIGAALEILSSPGAGTSVRLTMAVPESRAAFAFPTQRGR